MLFNSILFTLFLPAAIILARARIGWELRKSGLLLASYLFYAAWNPAFVVLLWISTCVDWQVGIRLAKTDSPSGRKSLLLLSLATNLGMLGVFKYKTFLIDNTTTLLSMVGVAWEPMELRLLLPVGISFYTFQTLSYTIDVYRRRLKPKRKLIDFALYVAFFPQLVAGPIVRASEFLPQLEAEKRATASKAHLGFIFLLIGLFQKAVLADQLMAPVVDRIYMKTFSPGFLDAWVGTIAFSAQIFFDFSGYSLCAIGAGLMLGFKLPENFRQPYGAVGFSDFWQRWHISLSSWFRDYLYLPLGGNRRGAIRTHFNLGVTMILGGLWHGASWSFVVWGAIHGAFLAAERLLRPLSDRASWTGTWLARRMGSALTYILVCVAWVFFRATDLSTAVKIVEAMFGMAEHASRIRTEYWPAMILAILLVVVHTRLTNVGWEVIILKIQPFFLVSVLALMLFFIAISADSRAFIYFQF